MVGKAETDGRTGGRRRSWRSRWQQWTGKPGRHTTSTPPGSDAAVVVIAVGSNASDVVTHWPRLRRLSTTSALLIELPRPTPSRPIHPICTVESGFRGRPREYGRIWISRPAHRDIPYCGIHGEMAEVGVESRRRNGQHRVEVRRKEWEWKAKETPPPKKKLKKKKKNSQTPRSKVHAHTCMY